MDFEQKSSAKHRFEKIYYENNVSQNCAALSRSKVSDLIAEIKYVKTNKVKKIPRHYWLLQHYDVIIKDDQEHLVFPLKNPNEEIRYYCAKEDVFEILYKIHSLIGHGGRDRMQVEVKSRYKNITRKEIQTFLNLCEVCKQNKRKSRKEIKFLKPDTESQINFNSRSPADLNSRCQIDVIDFKAEPDNEYKFIFVYEDYQTKYVVLRPIKTRTAKEIAEQVLQVFLLFGAPCILQSEKGRQFCTKVIYELKAKWPELCIVYGKPYQGSLQRVNREVLQLLSAWMNDNKRSRWSVGLEFVQFMKNRAFKAEINKSPYEAMFGRPLKVGLKSTTLPSQVYRSLLSEEDLEKVLTSTEDLEEDMYNKTEENTFNFPEENMLHFAEEDTSKFSEENPFESLEEIKRELAVTCAECNETIDFQDEMCCEDCEQSLHSFCAKKSHCSLCYSQKEIEETSSDSESKEKRKKLMPDDSFDTEFRVSVPDINCVALPDAQNILAVVVKKTDKGFCRVENRNEIIETLNSRSQFCDENVVPLNKVPKINGKLRSIVTTQSDENEEDV